MTLRRWIVLSVLLGMLSGCGGPYSSGDRVLVAKPNYDTGLTGPSRYDVVVFKFPEAPMDNNTPKNFIKRLLGLPGEIIAIFFGRLYHMPAPPEGQAPYYDHRNVDAKDLWTQNHRNDQKTLDWFEEGKFAILRKPPHVMLSMRRIVYDNDFQARDLKGKLDRWSPNPQSSWKTDQTTGFINDGTAADEVAWLRYQHLIRPDGAFGGAKKIDKMLILDSLGYNTFQTTPAPPQDQTLPLQEFVYPRACWVGDLMLEGNVEVVESKGEFWMELSKGIHRFRARFDLASGQCTLFKVSNDGKQEEMASQPTRLKAPGNFLVRLANIDARLTVWIDRDLPFGDGKEYDPPEIRGKDEKDLTEDDLVRRRGPDPKNDLEPASIGSRGAAVKVTHLRLWRDTYYRASADRDRGEANEMTREAWCDPSRWGPLRRPIASTMYVQPGHFLCLGDNSEASDDSRRWGLVPRRLMLGRALVVYYPLDRVGPIR